MDSGALHDLFRLETDDNAEPYLWSDEEVYAYLDDGQKMFCRLTGGIADATSAATQLSSTTTSDWVAISPLILKIRDAGTSDGRELNVINFEDLRKHGLRFDGRTGRVRNLVIGIEANKARLYPYPTEAETIQLIVDRLPLKPITDAGQKLEVAEQHHQHLLLWAKHRAYAKQDAETYDRNKSTEFEQRFRNYCEDAKAEKDRAAHKTRTVSYGGI